MSNHNGRNRSSNPIVALAKFAALAVVIVVCSGGLSGLLTLATRDNNPLLLSLAGIGILVYLASLLYGGES